VLTLQKAETAPIASLSTTGCSIEDLLAKQWLLTNGRGGYASSTVIGCNTSSYHGLLVGALDPPANRIMALANCLELIVFPADPSGYYRPDNSPKEKVFGLSTFEFDNKFAPQGFTYLRNFRRDVGVHFDYELEKLCLTKSIYLLRDSETVVIRYDFKQVPRAVEFVVRPFVGLRNFHTLQKSYAPLAARPQDNRLVVYHDVPRSCELFISCPGASFEKDEQWWFNFVYRTNAERGQDFTEDLWTPGFFRARIASTAQLLLWASLSGGYKGQASADIDFASVQQKLTDHYRAAVSVPHKNTSSILRTLCLAADAFITERQDVPTPGTTIVAGYPWFVDWGRDAFIALPGLMLATGRFEQARSVLTTFCNAMDHGMIPNNFDDRTGTAHFNSVDAPLWFINAAFQYLDATGDSRTFTQEFLPAIRWIIDSYQKGTRFGIHADSDGLITAGNSQTQLTWMDAKCDGQPVTPRHGKAVEVNALWYNDLRLMARFYGNRNSKNAQRYGAMADRAGNSFVDLFWNDRLGHLNDCILPDGTVDSSLRPNQIFAVSLPFSALPTEQQRAVVQTVQGSLLSPFGLRTLDPQDKRYKPKYQGPPAQRDQAYHQGTVWPYLIGPFVEAYLKINGYSRKSKRTAATFIQPLLEHLASEACIGNISEIFDGDPPHKPRGCIAQAWSVGELIRAYLLVHG